MTRRKGITLALALALAAAPLAAFGDGAKVTLQGGIGDLGGFRGGVHYYNGNWGFMYDGVYDDYGDSFAPFGLPADGMHELHELSIAHFWPKAGFGVSVGYFDTTVDFDSSFGTTDSGWTARAYFGQPIRESGYWWVGMGLAWYEGDLISGGSPVEWRDGTALTLDAGVRVPLGNSRFSSFGGFRLGWMADDFRDMGGIITPDSYIDMVPDRYTFGVDYRVNDTVDVFGGWEHILFDMGPIWNQQDRGTDAFVLGTRVRFN